MANNVIWPSYTGQSPGALLPRYIYPDWMNSTNYHLHHYGKQSPVYYKVQLPQSPWFHETQSARLQQTRRQIAARRSQEAQSMSHHRQSEIIPSATKMSYSSRNYPEKRKLSNEDDRYPSAIKRNKNSQNGQSLSYSKDGFLPLPTSHREFTDSSDSSEDDDLDNLDHQHKRLSAEIWEYYELHAQKEPDYRTKEELRRRLEEGIREVYRKSDLVLVGSSLNGFGCRGSDADFCLLVSLHEVDQRHDARYMLDEIHRYMKSNFSYIWKSCVIYAKVPIMRFTDRITGIECDININNITGIRNTHLLQAYSKADRRVVPLVLWIKHWAKSNGINDASQGTLSSYSIVLLVLHYLQGVCTPAVIPSLQETYQDIFNDKQDIFRIQASLNGRILPPAVQYKSRNMESLGELLMGFFKHVASFNFKKNIISVRRGTHFNLINSWRPQLIHIEEPFEKQNVARAVHRAYRFFEIMEKFKSAHQTLTEDHRCYLDDLLSLDTGDHPQNKKKKTKRQRIKEALKYITKKEKSMKKLIPFRSTDDAMRSRDRGVDDDRHELSGKEKTNPWYKKKGKR